MLLPQHQERVARYVEDEEEDRACPNDATALPEYLDDPLPKQMQRYYGTPTYTPCTSSRDAFWIAPTRRHFDHDFWDRHASRIQSKEDWDSMPCYYYDDATDRDFRVALSAERAAKQTERPKCLLCGNPLNSNNISSFCNKCREHRRNEIREVEILRGIREGHKKMAERLENLVSGC